MEIRPAGSQPSVQPNPANFTGTARFDSTFKGSGELSGLTVTFEPGARTAWHSHPRGQTLLVVAGLGWAQREGGSVEAIRPGDVVWFEADEKHWHGASAHCGMTHIAIAEMPPGTVTNWLEKVTDAEYVGPAR